MGCSAEPESCSVELKRDLARCYDGEAFAISVGGFTPERYTACRREDDTTSSAAYLVRIESKGHVRDSVKPIRRWRLGASIMVQGTRESDICSGCDSAGLTDHNRKGSKLQSSLKRRTIERGTASRGVGHRRPNMTGPFVHEG